MDACAIQADLSWAEILWGRRTIVVHMGFKLKG